MGWAAVFVGLSAAGIWGAINSPSWINWAACVVGATFTAPLGLLLLGLAAFRLSLAVGAFGMQLQTSDAGLEYRYRRYWIRCRWEDVDCVGKRGFLGLPFFETDVLWLHRVDFLGKRKRLPRLTPRPVVGLWGMEGWPRGALADELARRGVRRQQG